MNLLCRTLVYRSYVVPPVASEGFVVQQRMVFLYLSTFASIPTTWVWKLGKESILPEPGSNVRIYIPRLPVNKVRMYESLLCSFQIRLSILS